MYANGSTDQVYYPSLRMTSETRTSTVPFNTITTRSLQMHVIARYGSEAGYLEMEPGRFDETIRRFDSNESDLNVFERWFGWSI